MAQNRNILKPGREGIVKAKPEQLPQKGIRADVLPILEELDKLAKQHRGTAAGTAFLVAEGIVYANRVKNDCKGCVYGPKYNEWFHERAIRKCFRCRRYEGLPDYYINLRGYRYHRKHLPDMTEDTTGRDAERIKRIIYAAEKRRKEDGDAETERP